jgi:hypothetical protein
LRNVVVASSRAFLNPSPPEAFLYRKPKKYLPTI